MYLVNTPWWLRAIYPQLIWRMPTQEKVLYLTFDDGPHPTATPFVLDTLAACNAKASFFCIGKNVLEYPAIYERILSERHRVGNHTQHHANGWKVPDDQYLSEIDDAAKLIHSTLFRPPYGKIKRSQIKKISSSPNAEKDYKIIMWSVLSGDFDTSISAATCASNVIDHAGAGSIIVFHDSTKAWERMRVALPKVLEHFSKRGFRFESL